MNSYSSGKITAIMQTHCSPQDHGSDFFDNLRPKLYIFPQFPSVFIWQTSLFIITTMNIIWTSARTIYIHISVDY